MPKFKSEAQKRKFTELLAAGEITQDEFNKWHSDTGKTKLPERIKPKVKK